MATKLNISKCCVLSVHTKSKASIGTIYCINGVQLTVSLSVNDLGVLVDNNLSFKPHIKSIIAKATQRSGIFFVDLRLAFAIGSQNVYHLY